MVAFLSPGLRLDYHDVFYDGDDGDDDDDNGDDDGDDDGGDGDSSCYCKYTVLLFLLCL